MPFTVQHITPGLVQAGGEAARSAGRSQTAAIQAQLDARRNAQVFQAELVRNQMEQQAVQNTLKQKEMELQRKHEVKMEADKIQAREALTEKQHQLLMERDVKHQEQQLDMAREELGMKEKHYTRLEKIKMDKLKADYTHLMESDQYTQEQKQYYGSVLQRKIDGIPATAEPPPSPDQQWGSRMAQLGDGIWGDPATGKVVEDPIKKAARVEAEKVKLEQAKAQQKAEEDRQKQQEAIRSSMDRFIEKKMGGDTGVSYEQAHKEAWQIYGDRAGALGIPGPQIEQAQSVQAPITEAESSDPGFWASHLGALMGDPRTGPVRRIIAAGATLGASELMRFNRGMAGEGSQGQSLTSKQVQERDATTPPRPESYNPRSIPPEQIKNLEADFGNIDSTDLSRLDPQVKRFFELTKEKMNSKSLSAAEQTKVRFAMAQLVNLMNQLRQG